MFVFLDISPLEHDIGHPHLRAFYIREPLQNSHTNNPFNILGIIATVLVTPFISVYDRAKPRL